MKRPVIIIALQLSFLFGLLTFAASCADMQQAEEWAAEEAELDQPELDEAESALKASLGSTDGVDSDGLCDDIDCAKKSKGAIGFDGSPSPYRNVTCAQLGGQWVQTVGGGWACQYGLGAPCDCGAICDGGTLVGCPN